MMAAHNASCNGFFMASLAQNKLESLLVKPGRRKIGRPPGSKTRPDAPSKIARLQRDASGHFLPKNPPAPPPDARLVSNPAPPVTPAPAPAAAPVEARPDTELFGATPKFDGEAPPDSGAPDLGGAAEDDFHSTAPRADEAPPVDAPAVETPEDQRPLCEALFSMVVQILAMFFGPFWFPRKKGSDAAAGEVPFDEKEMVVEKLCKYFHSVGMAVLTPLQDLWLAIGLYCAPRIGLTFVILKNKFGKKKSANPPDAPGDTRFAKSDVPPEKPAETETAASI
jgi:hypothetical protein